MSRTKYTLINARVNIIFYVILFFVSLFSRKIYLTILGNSIVGLNSTLQNILGILNLAELGVWSATAFALYKFIHDKNHEKIKEVITIFGHFYKIIGYVIVGLSLIVVFFLPYIFKESGISIYFVIAAFLTFLYSNLLGFFFNYKQILIVADQRNYVIVIISNTFMVLKILMQILFLYLFEGSFYIWLLMEVIFATLNTIFLNHYVNKLYPWLRLQKYDKAMLNSHTTLLRDIKRLISHKFAGVVVLETDNIFIYLFAGLIQVTYYTNYTLIISRLVGLLNSFLNSGVASLGNLVASRDVEKINTVFWELLTLRYFFAGIIMVSSYFLIDPFITIWLGKEYVISGTILFLILFNSYVTITRYSVDSFLDSYGLYGHVWAPWAEAGLNLCITLVLGYKYGIIGILTGTAVSTILIVCIWKPYYLFSSGFQKSVLNYWANIFKHILVLLLTFTVVFIVNRNILHVAITYIQWIINGIFIFMSSFFIYGILIYVTSSGMRSLTTRMLGLTIKKTEAPIS
ncbi:MAG: sugar transporter [Ferruginibacter sp.]|nr:sugar transporter [Ferruginibacter sp.]